MLPCLLAHESCAALHTKLLTKMMQLISCKLNIFFIITISLMCKYVSGINFNAPLLFAACLPACFFFIAQLLFDIINLYLDLFIDFKNLFITQYFHCFNWLVHRANCSYSNLLFFLLLLACLLWSQYELLFLAYYWYIYRAITN